MFLNQKTIDEVDMLLKFEQVHLFKEAEETYSKQKIQAHVAIAKICLDKAFSLKMWAVFSGLSLSLALAFAIILHAEVPWFLKVAPESGIAFILVVLSDSFFRENSKLKELSKRIIHLSASIEYCEEFSSMLRDVKNNISVINKNQNIKEIVKKFLERDGELTGFHGLYLKKVIELYEQYPYRPPQPGSKYVPAIDWHTVVST